MPTVAEALERLAHLNQHGPTRSAFTFRMPFPATDAGGEVTGLDARFCERAT